MIIGCTLYSLSSPFLWDFKCVLNISMIVKFIIVALVSSKLVSGVCILDEEGGCISERNISSSNLVDLVDCPTPLNQTFNVCGRVLDARNSNDALSRFSVAFVACLNLKQSFWSYAMKVYICQQAANAVKNLPLTNDIIALCIFSWSFAPNSLKINQLPEYCMSFVKYEPTTEPPTEYEKPWGRLNLTGENVHNKFVESDN